MITTLLIHLFFQISIASSSTLYDFKVKSIEDEEVSLSKYKGKVILIANTASGCGYTPQYKGLQELQNKYKDQGFTVLGFPSNDFGGQEPGTNHEIKKFCTLNYKVNFPLFTKASVSGEKSQPLFKWLTADANHALAWPVRWNFEKFILSRDGRLVKRFKSGVVPESEEIQAVIRSELKKGL